MYFLYNMDNVIIKQLVEKLMTELRKEDTKEQLEENFIDPFVKYIGDKLYPYVVSAALFVTLIVALLMYSVMCMRKLSPK